MRILGVDTTRQKAKVFLVDTENTENSVFVEMSENIRHSEGLFLYIEKLLCDTSIKLADVDAFACVVGPGSFTGIRVGMSTIKGFNKVANKSIVSMNMFELVAPFVKNGVMLLNSTNTSCYFARIKNKNIQETGVIDKNAVAEKFAEMDIFVLNEEQSMLNDSYKNYKFITNLNELYINCVIDKMNTMQYGEFLPYYLQLSQAERNFKSDE